MKKIINLCEIFLVFVIVTSSFNAVGIDVKSFRELEKYTHELEKHAQDIDEYVATLPVKEQEEFRRGVDKYRDVSNLTKEEQLEYERSVAELFGRSYVKVLLEQIVNEAKNILYGSFDAREACKKTVAELINDEKLDAEINNVIRDDITIIIKESYGKNITKRVSNAYEHLRCVVAGIINTRFTPYPQGKIEYAIDYVSRKLQAVKLRICDMWYRQSAQE